MAVPAQRFAGRGRADPAAVQGEARVLRALRPAGDGPQLGPDWAGVCAWQLQAGSDLPKTAEIHCPSGRAAGADARDRSGDEFRMDLLHTQSKSLSSDRLDQSASRGDVDLLAVEDLSLWDAELRRVANLQERKCY